MPASGKSLCAVSLWILTTLLNKTMIHKALFEEFGGDNEPKKLNALKDVEQIDDNDTVQIPKALFDAMMKFLSNNKK